MPNNANKDRLKKSNLSFIALLLNTSGNWAEPKTIDHKIHIIKVKTITVIDICENRIKIGIEAPKHIQVHRTEVYDKIKNSKKINNIERFTN